MSIHGYNKQLELYISFHKTRAPICVASYGGTVVQNYDSYLLFCDYAMQGLRFCAVLQQ